MEHPTSRSPRWIRFGAIFAGSSVAIAATSITAAQASTKSIARAPAGSAARSPTTVTPARSGVVLIETNLAYEGAAAAGTGMVITPSGQVLTNNHVIRGATSIRVIVPATGRSYRAQVAGYDVADDIAVLTMQGAKGLATVSLGRSAGLGIGQAVTAIGNAGGRRRLIAAQGTVTGLHKSIVVSDEQGASSRLTGLVETNAPIEAGDSGGPLLDATDHVIGMDTAGSSSDGFASTALDAYAIPIDRAISIANQVIAGRATAAVHVGPTAFLGVRVGQFTTGTGEATTQIADVVPGSPADQAGLSQGEQIVAIDGVRVAAPGRLAVAMRRKLPGDTLRVTLVDASGAQRTVLVTLASGPAQ